MIVTSWGEFSSKIKAFKTSIYFNLVFPHLEIDLKKEIKGVWKGPRRVTAVFKGFEKSQTNNSFAERKKQLSINPTTQR